MKEKEINYPTNIQVFEDGLILGDLCLTQMNCHFNISLGRIELDIQYHHKNKVAIKSYKTFITIEEGKETFKKLLPRFENIVREAENICITKSIVLKDMVPNDFLLEADLALCTIKETFAQCFFTLFARFQNTKDNFDEIDNASTILDVINKDEKFYIDDFTINHLECRFDVFHNCLLVIYRYAYENANNFVRSETFRVLKNENLKDIIDYYPIFKLAVFAGLNNAKREYLETEHYYCEEEAIREELNKSFLITYVHIQVFKELNK